MTKKQLSMIQDLLSLLSSQSLKDWTFALSEVNPEITAGDISLLKKRLRRTLSKLSLRATRTPSLKQAASKAARSSNFTEENLLKGLFAQEVELEGATNLQRVQTGREFSRWLDIISSKEKVDISIFPRSASRVASKSRKTKTPRN